MLFRSIRQILAGLEMLDCDIVFLAEHDVLYHPSHFDFIPGRRDAYYYNINFWFVRYWDGFAVSYYQRYLSQICAYRNVLITAFENRLNMRNFANFRSIGKDAGYEPGVRPIAKGGIDRFEAIDRVSAYPNLDIKDHGTNATHAAWKPNRYTKNWKETYDIPYWGRMNFND